MKNTKKRALQLHTAAVGLIRDPKFFFRFLCKVVEMGVIGEKANILTLFLASVTKDFPKPVPVITKGPTSSGKNNATEAVVALQPPESVIRRSGLTAKALAYGAGSLAGKVLYLYQYEGGKDAQLLTRVLQSEGSISHEHTVTQGAYRGTEVAVRTGAPVILSTTTAERVYEDDETRFLSIRTDDSPELTRSVMQATFTQPLVKPIEPANEIWHEVFRMISNSRRRIRSDVIVHIHKCNLTDNELKNRLKMLL